MKKSIENSIFIIFRFLLFLLMCNLQNLEILYYKDLIIFISFELFGIIILYGIKKHIKNLTKKITFYLFFCFFIIKVFKYFNQVIIESLFITIMGEIILFVLILFGYSLIKKNKFYFIYAIIISSYFTIFMFFYELSSIPELNGIRINSFYVLVAYIGVYFLYFMLYKTNKKKDTKKK